ncbi:MAG: DegV family protein [Clostridia bacterium]
MNIKITSDSTSDLNVDYLTKQEIDIFPLYIHLGEIEYLDGITINPSKIISYVNTTKKLPSTSAVTIEDYKTKFTQYVKQGLAVIHFTISDSMSSSYNNALVASKGLPNVYVVNSQNLSTGIGLLIMYACDLRAKGLGVEEIFKKVTSRVPYVQASFVLDRLDYLYKGGRCSALALLGANVLMIRPSIEVKEGKMVVGKKQFGTLKHCIGKYIEDILAHYNNPDTTRIFFTTTTILEENRQLVLDILKEKTNFKEIIETKAGCTITSHCGPNCLGILFINDGGVKD